MRSTDGKQHDKGSKGAFQSFEEARKADVSCACHWTVNVAASNGHGRMLTDVYSVATAGIFVPADLAIKKPEDLAGRPISVGFQSGSHYATVQALEQYLKPDDINLRYETGMLFKRMEHLFDGAAPAVHLFNGPYYFAEQTPFPRQGVIDATFMIGTMIHGKPGPGRETSASSSARYARRNATSISGPNSTRIIIRTNSPTASTPRWTRGDGGRASA